MFGNLEKPPEYARLNKKMFFTNQTKNAILYIMYISILPILTLNCYLKAL